MPAGGFLAALTALSEGGVSFIVVGGPAAVLNGAPVNTFDLDIVHARDEENIARLLRYSTQWTRFTECNRHAVSGRMPAI